MVNEFHKMRTVRNAREHVTPAAVGADPPCVVQDDFYVREQRPAGTVRPGCPVVREDHAADDSPPPRNYEIRRTHELTPEGNLKQRTAPPAKISGNIATEQR